MPRRLRWQLALAGLGAVAIGVILSLFATRTFVDRPARGGRLVLAVTGRPVVLNPLLSSKEVEEDINRLVYAGLTRPSGDGWVEPDLAKGWEISPDGREYVFTLRTGLTFDDGAPLTARDVVFTANLARDPRLRGALSREALVWAGAQAAAPDDRTVKFTLSEPYAPFLAATTMGILAEHAFTHVRPADVPSHRASTIEPVGAGPFRLSAPGRLSEEEAALVRSPGYWRATARQPYLDEIVIRFAASADEAVAALGRQEVQATGGVPGAAVTNLTGDADLYSAPEPGYTLVYLNHRRPLYGDASVRRALSLGIDRAGIVADPAVAGGQGLVAVGPIPRGSWAFDAGLKPLVYDPEAARSLLAAAGWADSDGDDIRDREGQTLGIVLGVGPDPGLVAVAEHVRQAWLALGAGVTLRALDQHAVQEALTGHQYDALVFNWTLWDYDPDPFPLWHSSQIQSGQSFSGWSHPRADELLALARQAVDRETRAGYYHEFMRIFALEQPALILYHPMYTYGVVAGTVGGVQAPPLLARPADRFLTVHDWFVETERVVAGRRGS